MNSSIIKFICTTNIHIDEDRVDEGVDVDIGTVQ